MSKAPTLREIREAAGEGATMIPKESIPAHLTGELLEEIVTSTASRACNFLLGGGRKNLQEAISFLITGNYLSSSQISALQEEVGSRYGEKDGSLPENSPALEAVIRHGSSETRDKLCVLFGFEKPTNVNLSRDGGVDIYSD